ncbi:MAG: methyltransferase domain-containing protein [Desulfarculaceae bacterium]|nr:methyltransferase domain-containing protein [Desulfarculaceae bacterium]
MIPHDQPSPQDSFSLGPDNQTAAIFLISVLGLFLEIVMIRWVSTEVRIFAYLQNTILLVCFLGLSLGLFSASKPIKAGDFLWPLVILVFLLSVPMVRTLVGRIPLFMSVLEDFLVWDRVVTRSPVWAVGYLAVGLAATYALMYLVLKPFVPVGRILGRLMDGHPRIVTAYSSNVAGSLVGTWVLVAMSALFMPPIAWFALLAGLCLFFLPWRPKTPLKSLVLLAAIVAFSGLSSYAPGTYQVVWSPYQKLSVQDADHISFYSFKRGLVDTLIKMGVNYGGLEKWGKNPKMPGDNYGIKVNNSGYQKIMDLRPETVAKVRHLLPAESGGLVSYDVPPMLHPDPKKMLIVGAGSGNDAAGALRGGVSQVVAVDIDPAIVDIGRRMHPEKPYSDKRVRVVIDDARSYFTNSKEKFDVVSFGALDSHTTTHMSNNRLDHFVYTKQAFEQAKGLLAPGGVMVVYFAAEKPYIADRLARTLREVFHQEPLVFKTIPTPLAGSGYFFVAGDQASIQGGLAKHPELARLIAVSQARYELHLPGTTEVTTDDWPFVYLPGRGIPLLFYLLAGLMTLLFFHAYRRFGGQGIARHWERSHWHFFFLGAAFLLLEVLNISRAAVVLGNTWWVNSVIISGVLGMILLANLIALRWPAMNLSGVFAALFVICIGLYFMDLTVFAGLPIWLRAIAVGGLTCLPLFCSGIIFIQSFAKAELKNEALGSNLLGAMCGALVQWMSFLTGFKTLMLVILAFYLLAYFTRLRAGQGQAEAARA